jgi:hypothetical protein
MAFEQQAVQFVGYLGCRDGQLFTGRGHQTMLDAAQEKDPGDQGHQGHQDDQLRQPSIALGVERLLEISFAHAHGASEQMLLCIRISGW